jgi:hypothetical protein
MNPSAAGATVIAAAIIAIATPPRNPPRPPIRPDRIHPIRSLRFDPILETPASGAAICKRQTFRMLAT